MTALGRTSLKPIASPWIPQGNFPTEPVFSIVLPELRATCPLELLDTRTQQDCVRLIAMLGSQHKVDLPAARCSAFRFPLPRGEVSRHNRMGEYLLARDVPMMSVPRIFQLLQTLRNGGGDVWKLRSNTADSWNEDGWACLLDSGSQESRCEIVLHVQWSQSCNAKGWRATLYLVEHFLIGMFDLLELAPNVIFVGMADE